MGSLDRRYKKTGKFYQDEPGDDVDYPELVTSPVEWDDDIDFDPERVTCPECGGEGAFLGSLGKREQFRCINCGIDFSRPQEASKTADYTSQDGMMDGGWGSTVPQDTWAWEKNPNEYNICKQCGSEYKVEPHGYGGWDTLCRMCGRTLAAKQSGMIEITGDFADWVQDHAPTSATAGEVLSAALEAENPGYEVLEAYMCEDYAHIIAYLQLKPEEEAHQGGHKDGQ